MAETTVKHAVRFTQEQIDRILTIGKAWDRSQGSLLDWFTKHTDEFPGRKPEALVKKFRALTSETTPERQSNPAVRLNRALAEFKEIEGQIATLMRKRDEKKEIIRRCLAELQEIIDRAPDAETASTTE